jgi:hypothetical protein
MALANVLVNIRDAVEAPLTERLNAEHLFLIVGVVVIAWGFWVMVLGHLREVLPVE